MKDWVDCTVCQGTGEIDDGMGNRLAICNVAPGECYRCKDWERMGLSNTCPDCDAALLKMFKEQDVSQYDEIRELKRELESALERNQPNVDAIREYQSQIIRLELERDSLKDANARLKAELWVANDSRLRTYDGLTERHDRYEAALKEIAKDFGTDHCDGNTMIAHEALYPEIGDNHPDLGDEQFYRENDRNTANSEKDEFSTVKPSKLLNIPNRDNGSQVSVDVKLCSDLQNGRHLPELHENRHDVADSVESDQEHK